MRSKEYEFPIRRPHSGVPVSNGMQGLLVWGEGHLLKITVGRAGFWDHRGGTAFTAAVKYPGLRSMLEGGRELELGNLFKSSACKKSYDRPCQLGTGRIEISLAAGWQLESARLGLDNGEVLITVASSGGERGGIRLHQSRAQEATWLVFEGLLPEAVAARPVWDWEEARLKADGVAAPDRWSEACEGGFRQCLPKDPAVALAWKLSGSVLHIVTRISDEDLPSIRAALWANRPDLAADTVESARWWEDFQGSLPRLRLPDAELQGIWELHSYKLAGAHPPSAPAGSLQSAWMEDHRLPPWSNDYHFNINLQMMYWPCLGANRLDHFEPLWRMLKSWFPALKSHGEEFFGAPGAMMLPHAVDDRCQVVGSFWAGTIDHGCTAWVAQMAWLHYRHSMDEEILRDLAWPLLNGAFEGFWAMAEETSGGRLELPVTVSPEYHACTESGVKLWGRNASFQLAAFHMVARLLITAAGLLGESLDPRWERVQRQLPDFSTTSGRTHKWGQAQSQKSRIALWEDQDLDESHRHHSHLAGIYPFQTIDVHDPSVQEVVRESLGHWLAMGAGKWAGWSFPWASILCSRCNLGDAAVAWLKWWNNVFTNPGGAPLHDADFPGCGVLHAGRLLGPEESREVETMQLDAGCGALQAILEILVQQRGNRLHILPSLPARWRNLDFDGIRVEGAFLVGATVERGKIIEIRVRSEKGGTLEMVAGSRQKGLCLQMKPSETLSLSPESFENAN